MNLIVASIFFVKLLNFISHSSAFSPNFGQNDIERKTVDNVPVRFFVIADWGGLPFPPYETPAEATLASAMGRIGDKLNTSFQLALGDNFYFKGVENVNDPRFHNTFERVFSAASLQTPWYVVAGNHDHIGNVSAQIEYGKFSKRWIFPDYFYTFSLWQQGAQSKLVDFIMIDTVILCGGTNQTDWDDEQVPKRPELELKAEFYWLWIEEQLKQSTAPYLIVGGHYPVYSISEHGPTQCLVDRLKPLLYQYRASAYLCGHDHNLQHLLDIESGISMNFFVIGAGNFIDKSRTHEKDIPPNSLKFFWADSIFFGGFALIEVDERMLNVSFIDRSEKTLYQTSILPKFYI